MSTALSTVTVTVPDGNQNVKLVQGENILVIHSDGTVSVTRSATSWFETAARMKEQLKLGHALQLEMDRSEGKLRIVAAEGEMKYLDHILGDLPEMTDEFVDAITKANYRLAHLKDRQ